MYIYIKNTATARSDYLRTTIITVSIGLSVYFIIPNQACRHTELVVINQCWMSIATASRYSHPPTG